LRTRKDCDGLVHAVASGCQIPRLGRSAKGPPIEIDCCRDWLCPEGNYSHREMDFCLTGEEAVFLDQVASELGETIPLTVTLKDRTEDGPEISPAARGRAAYSMPRVDERSEKLSSQGVEIVRGDLSDFEAVSEALKGITAAYFVFPIKVPGILEATAFYPSLPDQLVDCGPGFRPVLLRRENFGLHHQEIIRALWHSSYRLENLQRVLPTLLRLQDRT
jgi:hypothetical protein